MNLGTIKLSGRYSLHVMALSKYGFIAIIIPSISSISKRAPLTPSITKEFIPRLDAYFRALQLHCDGDVGPWF